MADNFFQKSYMEVKKDPWVWHRQMSDYLRRLRAFRDECGLEAEQKRRISYEILSVRATITSKECKMFLLCEGEITDLTMVNKTTL